MSDRILEEAKWVVLLFDQANTGGRVERIGSRGVHLKNAVEDLREAMLAEGVDPHKTREPGVWSEGWSNP